MKIRFDILILAMATFVAVACVNDNGVVDFGSDTDVVEVEAVGGVKKIRISSNDEWVAKVGKQDDAEGTPNPWITVSPANGRGSVTCDFLIDSALTTQPRSAVVQITNVVTNKTKRITVKQKGYEYGVEVDKQTVERERDADYGKRYFDVVVRSNFEFDIKIPDSERSWLSYESYDLDLNRGVRPREVKVRFNWKINNQARVRLADVKFVPRSSDVVPTHSDIMSVSQEAAEPIEPDTRAGDSLSLINIATTMQCWNQYDTSVSMDRWGGVTLWKEGAKGCTPEKVGRVRRVEIFLCNSFEGLPYEVRYLTAAEEIYIFSNENSMLKSINLGEHILELSKNLKRLTVGAFGLTELPANFKMEALEFLDLGSNNFQSIPSVINEENLPNLRALVLNAQQRHAVADLSQTVYKKEELGGFIEEESVPERLLLWGRDKQGLDTLVLSVNYMHGELPSFEDRADVPRWEQADIDRANRLVADSLPQALIGVPKIMSKTKTFRINHNRFRGELPRWLLMHPELDWWIPLSLVFPQEGRDIDGVKAGFTNAPASLVQYYTEWYPNKKMADSINEEIPEDDSEIITK